MTTEISVVIIFNDEIFQSRETLTGYPNDFTNLQMSHGPDEGLSRKDLLDSNDSNNFNDSNDKNSNRLQKDSETFHV